MAATPTPIHLDWLATSAQHQRSGVTAVREVAVRCLWSKDIAGRYMNRRGLDVNCAKIMSYVPWAAGQSVFLYPSYMTPRLVKHMAKDSINWLALETRTLTGSHAWRWCRAVRKQMTWRWRRQQGRGVHDICDWGNAEVHWHRHGHVERRRPGAPAGSTYGRQLTYVAAKHWRGWHMRGRSLGCNSLRMWHASKCWQTNIHIQTQPTWFHPWKRLPH